MADDLCMQEVYNSLTSHGNQNYPPCESGRSWRWKHCKKIIRSIFLANLGLERKTSLRKAEHTLCASYTGRYLGEGPPLIDSIDEVHLQLHENCAQTHAPNSRWSLCEKPRRNFWQIKTNETMSVCSMFKIYCCHKRLDDTVVQDLKKHAT